MKIQEITDAVERVAPLRFQEEWDNSGLQVGFPGGEVRKVLVCLDVTEEIVREAVEKGCNLIVSHHPLLFRGLKQVSDATYQQRCVVAALEHGVAIYSAHTSLDNAPGGVNFRIAEMLGLGGLRWLEPAAAVCCPESAGAAPAAADHGSGLIGELPEPEDADAFFARLARTFDVSCLRHSGLNAASGSFVPGTAGPAPVASGDGTGSCRKLRRIALCGGAGAFLIPAAVRSGADCFISGEFHYHDYFETGGMLLAELGHYQSEQFTIDLLSDILKRSFPGLEVVRTALCTNPIQYGI